MKFKKLVTMVIMVIMVFTLILPNVTLAGGPTDGIYCPRCKGGDKVVLYQNGQFCNGHAGDTTIHHATCTDAGYIICTKCPGQGGVGSADHEFNVNLGTEPPLGHDFSVLIKSVPSTCNTIGYKLWGCSHTSCNCKATYLETLSLDPNNHEDVRTDYGYPATCAETGLTDATYCEACDTTIVEHESIPKLEPEWDEWHVTTKPTCTEAGVELRVCKNCDGEANNHIELRTIEPKGHVPGYIVIENEVPPTCTEDGSYDGVIYCSVCNEELSRKSVVDKALGHDYKLTEHVDPTCEEDGYDYYECQHDASHNYKETIDKLNHDYKLISHVDATCLEGYDYYECKNDSSHNYKDITPATGHQLVQTSEYEVKRVEPTCYEDGYITYICNNNVSEHTWTILIPTAGHDWIEVGRDFEDIDDYTHTEHIHYDCSKCDETKEEVIEGENHAYSLISLEAIVTEGDTTTHTWWFTEKCDDCGHVYTFIAQWEGDEVEPHNAKQIGHEDATCTEDGFNKYECEDCHYVWTEVIDKLGHDINHTEAYLINHVDPTCTEDGSDTYKCARCEYTETDTINKLGHNPGEPVIENRVEPTHTESGSYDEVIYCDRCGEELSRENKSIDPLGHDWKEYVKEHKDPTCTEDGYDIIHKNCDCGEDEYVRTDIIPATGHTWDDNYEVVIKEATEDAEGLIEIRHNCVVCGIVEVVGYKAIPKIGSLAPVQTGDNNNTALFVTMGGAAICLIVACLILLNRRRAK